MPPRVSVLVTAVLVLHALASRGGARAAHRADADFEFDDDRAQAVDDPRDQPPGRRDGLCAGVACGAREVCAESSPPAPPRAACVPRATSQDDVFLDAVPPAPPARCVGCGARAGGAGGAAHFLCGSDNRTYSSLCRLDLHNCVRRPRPAVTLACRGFCPCAPRAPPRPPAPVDDDDDDELQEVETTCGAGAAGALADRLLDWFAVLMDAAGELAPPRHARDGFPRDCKPEVRWMFAHLDTDGDGRLSPRNLYALRHDDTEQCLRPFLRACRAGAPALSRAAWCACLRGARRPCAALARAVRGARARGAYVPACDARGYYRPRQCHRALGVCWCVSPHGVERPGSRTKGAPHCAGPEGAPADDEDEAGSGAGPADLDARY